MQDVIWVDLRMSPDRKWWSGGYKLNDHEVEHSDAKQIEPSNYNDMSSLGKWNMDIPTFNESLSDEENSGICSIPCC